MDNVEASHGANHREFTSNRVPARPFTAHPSSYATEEDEPPTLQRRAVKRTPAQLEKKRAADREAQRVTRERTKNRIESLEKLVQTLSNTEHSPGCTSALKERDEARAELADVRARLGSIISSLQSVTTPSATAQESGECRVLLFSLSGVACRLLCAPARIGAVLWFCTENTRTLFVTIVLYKLTYLGGGCRYI